MSAYEQGNVKCMHGEQGNAKYMHGEQGNVKYMHGEQRNAKYIRKREKTCMTTFGAIVAFPTWRPFSYSNST